MLVVGVRKDLSCENVSEAMIIADRMDTMDERVFERKGTDSSINGFGL